MGAIDKRGNAVSLEKTSLKLYVDKKEVPIEELKPANDAPIRFVLLLDLSGSNVDKLKFEKQAATRIFEALSKGKNEGYFGWFNQKVHISTHPMQLSEVNQFLGNVTTNGATALYDAITAACEQTLHAADDTRRVLFVITDGEDNQSHVTAAEAVAIAQRERVPVFALGLLSWAPNPRGRPVLTTIARETGGNVVVLDSAGQFLEKLLAPLNNQYFLTFTSPPALQKKTTHIELKPSDHSIQILAPSAYSIN